MGTSASLVQRIKKLLLAGFAAALSLAAIPVRASVVYTDRIQFNNATSNRQTITFEGLAPTGGLTSYPEPTGLTQQGVNFRSSTNSLLVIDPGYQGGGTWNFPSGQYLNNNNYTGTSLINITLPANTYAVGADVGLQTNQPAEHTFTSTVTLQTASGEVFSQSFNADPNTPVLSFYGFKSTVPITTMSIKAAGNEASGSAVVDNFTFMLPEPTSLGLFMLGGVGLLARRRRV